RSRLGLSGCWPRRARPFRVSTSATPAASRAEHDQLADVDLGGVLRLTVLVLPLAVLDASLDVQLVALLHIPLHDVGERRRLRVPHNAPVPFRLFLLGTAGVVPRPAGRE